VYKFDDLLVGETFRPTSSPTITKVEPNSAVAIEEDNTRRSSIPWWTWLLVALAVTICILISCCYMNRSKDEMDEEKEQQLTMYVNDQMYSSNKSKSGQASVAASHRTYRTQHRSNRGGDDNMFLGQPIAASRSSKQRRQPPRKVRGPDQSSRATKRSQRPRSKKQSGHRRTEEMSTATDPPEEISQALVVHTRKYDDDNQTGADPEGDKISPKKSMYASGALMEEVHRERQEKLARRKPKRRGTIEKLKSSLRWNQKYTDGELEEANDEIVPYIPEPEEEYDEQYTERNQSNPSNNNSRKPPRKKSSFGEKLRASFNWRQSQQPFDDPVNDPIFSTSLQTNDLEDCPQIDLEVGSTDSPSILTNRNPGDGDILCFPKSDDYEEDREYYDREKKKRKKEKKSKSRRRERESSKKRSSGNSDRRSSRKKQGLLASFTRRKSITWNDGGGSGDEEPYNREYERDDGYSSRES